MTPLTTKVSTQAAGPSQYEIRIGRGLLADTGSWSRAALPAAVRRVLVVSNPTVFKLYGDQVITSLSSAGFEVFSFLMKDGERYKNIRSLESCLAELSHNGISRTDALVALGGGVVGDLAGFAASVHQRGISFLQIPTTLLAMVDSSVGGKTGINSAAGKNLIGAFHQPAGVLVDLDSLSTLPPRELTAGFCEMIKQAAISGGSLLRQTDEVLRSLDRKDLASSESGLASLIKRNVEFKAQVVTGDERESSARMDERSRKILNFGHTLAHALEKVTDYRHLRHGEAVGYGILFAAELSKKLAFLSQKDVDLLNDVVHRAGPLPSIANIDGQAVLEAFRFDKKRVSGSLQFVLLKGIGRPAIVSQNDIPLPTIKQALRTVLR